MLKVIFDTHAIVSAALYEKSLPALLLSLGLEEKVRFFISPALLNEYETVLKKPRFKLEHQETVDLIEKIKQKAVMVIPTREIEILKDDETDNRILECAAKAKVDFVITGNKRHFPFEDFNGSKIVTPREFINHLSEL
jgi:uncharacterized protein